MQGRSALSFARIHAGQSVVMRMDLEDFFPSIGAARVYRLFRSFGYVRDVVDEAKANSSESIASVATASSASEPSGRRLDALFERVSRDLFTTDTGLLALLTGAPTSPGMAELQEQFKERCSSRCSLILALIWSDLANATERIEQIRELDPRVLDAARKLISAAKALDTASVNDAAVELQTAVCVSVFDQGRQRLTERFGDLAVGEGETTRPQTEPADPSSR